MVANTKRISFIDSPFANELRATCWFLATRLPRDLLRALLINRLRKDRFVTEGAAR